MATREDALRRLDILMETLESPKDAYVVRSRLDRALVVVRRHLAEVNSHNDSATEDLIQGVEAGFAALRRRSEPFGEAWLRRLEEAKQDVANLKGFLEGRPR